VSTDAVVTGCEEILADAHGGVDEEAFYMIGSLDDLPAAPAEAGA
jgi:F0F1-type ATP synthase beta subunit